MAVRKGLKLTQPWLIEKRKAGEDCKWRMLAMEEVFIRSAECSADSSRSSKS